MSALARSRMAQRWSSWRRCATPSSCSSRLQGHSVSESKAGDPLEILCATLHSQELLLVLDNAEHLREAAPSYVHLLAGAPRLKLLVTSRAVLHLTGERVYPVEPLAEEAATGLFVERAQEAEPRFRADAAIRPVIRRICERLDGLPLAIELAASRARTLTPVELLARLDPRLPLLTGGPRDLPARQQTLRATLEWSYELLPPAARRLFARLSVFAGGFSLEAAQAICDADLHALETLRAHSLLQRAENGSESRFAMLETIREYADDRLPRRSRDHTGSRHAAYFARNVMDTQADSGRPADYFRWLAVEEANIRAALERLREHGEHEEEAALLVAVADGWPSRGILHHEVRSALEAVLQRDLSIRRRADVVGVLANFIVEKTDASRRVELATEAVALARSLDEPALLATSLNRLGGAQL